MNVSMTESGSVKVFDLTPVTHADVEFLSVLSHDIPSEARLFKRLFRTDGKPGSLRLVAKSPETLGGEHNESDRSCEHHQ